MIALVAALVILLDQTTKSWALDHLTVPRHVVGPINLTLTFNRGAAFSIGTGISPIVEAVVVVLIVALVGFSGRLTSATPLWVYGALGLVLGGALGNLADRLLRDIPFHHGAVVDFIQAVSWWPVFNVADAAIVIGIAALVLYFVARDRGPGRNPPGRRTSGGRGMVEPWRIPPAVDGERLDRALCIFTGLSRSEVSGLIDNAKVSVAGRVVQTRSRRVRSGELVEVEGELPAGPAALEADADVEVPVVWFDDEIIVVDKPAGLVVHPGAGNPTGTLVQGLLARFPDLRALEGDLTSDDSDQGSGRGGAIRPGIVHRLDKGTSGLLVVARTHGTATRSWTNWRIGAWAGSTSPWSKVCSQRRRG